MIVTCHQVNLLPGRSVIEKLAAADVFVACDEFQFVRQGWVNRNRLADGTWLIAPVKSQDLFAPINRVRLADQPVRWREKLARTVEQRFGDVGGAFAEEIRRPWRLLVGLNAALLRLLLVELDVSPEWVFQSHLESGRHWGPVVSDDAWELVTASERLAAMVDEVGGSVYLSGPSGRHYLDERPFNDLNIAVRYFDWDGQANPCGLEMLAVRQLEEGELACVFG